VGGLIVDATLAPCFDEEYLLEASALAGLGEIKANQEFEV
jgi:hypothetical protein